MTARRTKRPAILFILRVLLSIFGITGIQGYAAVYAAAPKVISAPGRTVVPVAYLAPFGGSEMNSTDITPFYKMTGVLARMDDSLKKHQPQPWTDNKTLLQSLSPRAQAQKINHIINSYPYVSDITNWGVTDYWETPDEFFEDGGDCEDFALAKYAWLHSLGVPERRLRIAIVHDTIKDATHAVLILYINRVALVLDDQVDEIREGRAVTRYRMLYSINRLGWWLPALSGLPAPSVVPAE